MLISNCIIDYLYNSCNVITAVFGNLASLCGRHNEVCACSKTQILCRIEFFSLYACAVHGWHCDFTSAHARIVTYWFVYRVFLRYCNTIQKRMFRFWRFLILGAVWRLKVIFNPSTDKYYLENMYYACRFLVFAE